MTADVIYLADHRPSLDAERRAWLRYALLVEMAARWPSADLEAEKRAAYQVWRRLLLDGAAGE